jgi:hypothetical protein
VFAADVFVGPKLVAAVERVDWDNQPATDAFASYHITDRTTIRTLRAAATGSGAQLIGIDPRLFSRR